MYRSFRGRTVGRAGTGALVIIAVCSCAVIQSPYVAPGKVAVAKKGSPPDFSDAATYASGKANELHKMLTRLDAYDRGTGAVILASGVAGIALGAYGAHSDAVLGASFAGTAAYGAREYLPIQERKKIYANGASAIRCAIATLRFDGLAQAINETKDAKEKVAAHDLKVKRLERLDHIRSLAKASTEEAVKSVDEFIEKAEAVKKEAMLIAATDAILGSVTDQLIRAQINPSGATDALKNNAEAHTSTLRDAYRKLEASASAARETSEALENLSKSTAMTIRSVKALVEQAGLQVVESLFSQWTTNGTNPASQAETAAVAAEQNTSNLDAVVASADDVLEILDLKSTCAAQQSP